MRSTIRVLAGLAALSAAACVSSVSFAQTPAPGAAPAAAASHEHGDREHWAERMRAHAEARIRALHDILNLRPDQEAAFQTFIASMKPEHPESMDEHHDMEEMAHLTTPQRFDRMAARMAERQAEFQRHADAVKRFYAVLSPEQQRAFDALHGMMAHGGHGMGGHGMGKHGAGGPGGEGHAPHGAD